MKRILPLLFLSTLFLSSQSQVLFNQDFESGSIAPMTVVDVDGKTVHANVASFAGPTWTLIQQTATNSAVVSTSWFNPPGIADDWIISPAITISQLNTILIWQAYSPDAAYRDGYEVRISTTDNQIASFSTIALTIPAELTTLQSRSLNLDAYVGQTIHFAFRNNSNDKFLLFLDNIRVEVFRNVNAIVRGVSFEKYNPVTTQVPIKVTVENHGANPLTSLFLEWTSGGYTYVDTITGLNITTLGTSELTHYLNFNVASEGEFPIDIAVTNPNGVEDEDPADNYGGRTIYGLSEQLPKKVVVEEGTGTWCGWCPRGFVIMEKIAVDYPEIALPIAIHNFDPMTVPSYDAAFSGTIPGYPSGHVDRKEIAIDPDDPNTHYGFDDAIENLDERMVPVELDVETSYNEATRTVQIKGIARISIPTLDNNLRFSCVITENNVTGTSDPVDQTKDYDQTNYYAGGANGIMGGFEKLPDPVPASEVVYNFVARALLGGFDGMEGSIPDELDANEYFDVNFTYQVPAGYDVNEMEAIVFIVDDETGEILNGDNAKLTGTVSIPLVPGGKSALYPNPASDVLNLTVEYQTDAPVQMNIYDTYGRLIQSLGQLDLSNGKTLHEINIAELLSGMYILELRHKNSVTALPFTKL